MKPWLFILSILILIVVAAIHISHRGGVNALLKGKTHGVEQEAREELAALQNIDLDQKVAELNRARQLQGLPTYDLP